MLALAARLARVALRHLVLPEPKPPVHDEEGKEIMVGAADHAADVRMLAGVARLAATLPSCRIQQLGLCGNGIGSAGVEHLAGVLPHCADLRMLDLRWNEIGDDGARALAAALPLVKRAVKLHVQFNSLSERAEGILLRTSKA